MEKGHKRVLRSAEYSSLFSFSFFFSRFALHYDILAVALLHSLLSGWRVIDRRREKGEAK